MPPRTLPTFLDTTPPADAINVTQTLNGQSNIAPRPPRPTAPAVDPGAGEEEGTDLLGNPAKTVIRDGEGARIGNGSQDAAMLAALGPEYAQEGQRLLNDPSARRQDITGRNETTGESFVMPVGNRVSRGALVPAIMRIQSEIAAKKLAEQQAQKFGQEQTMARIPGENAVNLAKQQGADKLNQLTTEGEIQAPTRTANINKTNAETAGLTQQQTQNDQTYRAANSDDARARAAADAAIKYIQDNQLATTPEGRQVIAENLPNSTMGRGMTQSSTAALAKAASGQSPAAKFEVARGFLQDPEVQRLMNDIKASKQGLIDSPKRRNQQAASVKRLEGYAQQYAAAKNADPQELLNQLADQFADVRDPATLQFRALGKMWDTATQPFR